MAASPVNFLFCFLVICITLWLLFIFYSRLLAWILSRVVGASIRFQFGGWKCIRDLMVEFKKGAVESVSVGEIKLSLRQSLVKLFGFISIDPKLQVLICDLEVVMRPSSRSTAKAKPKFLLTKNRDTSDSEEDGTRHFMVNVIEPQFNLHSEDANGRFLLAAVSGRVLARSFHSVLQVDSEMLEQALGTGNVNIPE
ncbi:hypothetical protein DVH24_033435 [Malus domestica]|uniref:Uncharacterized protein n=1 Tax=Malus domestica TaxID=3750 RepID=A0A498J9S5_MALDO|nr:hypothetical protein DVH24_033435 [Malus domestica]